MNSLLKIVLNNRIKIWKRNPGDPTTEQWKIMRVDEGYILVHGESLSRVCVDSAVDHNVLHRKEGSGISEVIDGWVIHVKALTLQKSDMKCAIGEHGEWVLWHRFWILWSAHSVVGVLSQSSQLRLFPEWICSLSRVRRWSLRNNLSKMIFSEIWSIHYEFFSASTVAGLIVLCRLQCGRPFSRSDRNGSPLQRASPT